ncbi:MAG: carboxypeptidase-like regulatory domain-containing protein, partial [Chitinophagaceae bacterium]|nr:carboxypeptidase-like regulatory domain-containing protein [Chitinophagaceae bacterium]
MAPIKKFFQKAFLLIILSHGSFSLFGQITISGKVTDKEGKGIPNISVVVRNTQFGSSTGNDGQYSFSVNLRPGNYVLDFTGIGFKMYSADLVISSQNAYAVNASLSEDAIGMDEVVVTGTLGRTAKRQLGNSISTINAKQLQNTGAQILSAMLSGRVMG